MDESSIHARAFELVTSFPFACCSLGECWSGPEASDTFSTDGPSEKCVGHRFKVCNILSHEACTGREMVNFVYSILM